MRKISIVWVNSSVKIGARLKDMEKNKLIVKLLKFKFEVDIKETKLI